MAERRHLVLLVDDHVESRDALATLLENEGFGVRQTSDGQEALDALAHGLRPCLVLLDLMMPTMDGWEFRERQLAAPELADIPVVVVSGHEKAHAAAIGLKARVLLKPVNMGVLLGIVRQYCQGREEACE